MVAKYERKMRWWPRAAAFGMIAWEGWTPLTALADIGEPKIGVVSDSSDQPVAFEAVGLSRSQQASLRTRFSFDPAFKDVFAVYVVTSAERTEQEKTPPISGKYSVDGAKLTFSPRHPLKPGLKYRAVLKVPGVSDTDASSTSITIEREFDVPELAPKPIVRTAIEQIYPTSDVLPENQLRFYIHFSQPISRGEAYQHLQVLDESGSPIESPFLEIGEELWDPHGKRFTLLLDPGRVKRELKPCEELGPIFERGKSYTLLVKSEWRDVNGQPLTSEFRKKFRVGPAIEEAIDLRQWTVSVPAAGTRQAFVVEFPHSLDHALLERTIWLADGNEARIRGQIVISNDERIWKFLPETAWSPGVHQLLIESSLEDTSGNRIGMPFEIDQLQPITRTIDREIIRLPFEVLLVH